MTKQPKHWFYVPDIGHKQTTAVLVRDEAVHAVKVLRQKVGDIIGLIDGKGCRATAEIRHIKGAGNKLQVAASVKDTLTFPPPRHKLHLYIALTKAKQMANVFKQATEIGVWEITPLICDYSIAALPAGVIKANWHQDIISAMKQSRNPFLPALHPVSEFTGAVQNAPATGFFGSLERAVESVDEDDLSAAENLSLWIGPEGGFSDAEDRLLRRQGFIPVQVAPWVLRVETAVSASVGWLRGNGLQL